ncbi:MAG: hypothetical protein QNJ20_07875 [Paracoccaceae bacterium]|nr:hypothetical protein [Paracoccaceae bacterium]
MVVRAGEGFEVYHWSIRKQGWRPTLLGEIGTCLPRTDFAEALRSGGISGHDFVVGDAVYRIPADRAPVATRTSLRFTPSEPGPVAPGTAVNLHIAGHYWVPEGVRSLAEVPAGETVDVEVLQNGGRLEFAGTDARGRAVVIACLRGRFGDRRCAVRFQVAGGAIFDFHLPLAHLERWAEAADWVEVTIASYEIDA